MPRLHCTRAILALAVITMFMSGSAQASADPGKTVSWRELAAAAGASTADFEAAWNMLFVRWLDSGSIADADSGAFRETVHQLAAAERDELHTRIAADALALAGGWSAEARHDRVLAQREEDAGWKGVSDPEAPADSLLLSALARYRRLGEQRRAAWTMGRLGGVYLTRGRLVEADSIGRIGLVARRALGDSALVGRSLNDLGQVALKRGRHTEAVAWLLQARHVRAEIHSELLPATLGLLATGYARSGESDSAAACFRLALSLPLDATRKTDLWLNYTDFLRRSGRISEASAAIPRVEALLDSVTDQQKWALRERVSELLRDEGRLSEALLERQELAQDALADGDTLRWVVQELAIGEIQLAAYSAVNARAAFLRAKRSATVAGDTALRGRAALGLARTSELDGHLTEATRHAEQARAYAEASEDAQLLHDAHAVLSDLAWESRDLALAAEHAHLAMTGSVGEAGMLRLADRLRLAVVWIHSGELDSARAELHDIANVAEAQGFLETASLARLDLADALWRAGERDSALDQSRVGLAILERQRAEVLRESLSIPFFSNRADEYDAYFDLLWKARAGRPTRADVAETFLLSERAHARALLDRRTGLSPGNKALVLDLASVQRSLEPDAMLLEYCIGDSAGFCWAVTRREARMFAIPSRASLSVRVTSLYSLLARPQPMDAALHARLQQLGDQLLAGAPEDTTIRRLIVVTDGPLGRLPFECLEGRSGRWLDRFVVSYAPSASWLFAPRHAKQAQGVLAIGAVTYSEPVRASTPVAFAGVRRSYPLSPLPNSAAELLALRSLIPAAGYAELSGRRASSAAVLACPQLETAAIVHFSTHAIADEIDPGNSSIFLAPLDGSHEASRLTARQASELSLDARLVTLATCESGVGSYAKGEGVMSLAHSFLAAGAGSVLVSLWPVSDASTARLMAGFYRRLLRNGARADDALAQAKRALGAMSPLPYYWAPFILVGEAGTVSTGR